MKRGIDCKSLRDETLIAHGGPSSDPQVIKETVEQTISALHVAEVPSPPINHMPIHSTSSNSSTNGTSYPRIPGLHTQKPFISDEQAFTLKFENPSNHGPAGPLLPTRSIPDAVTKEYYELYLAHFHHRWPILHVPTFEKGEEPYVLKASVESIGAWLYDTPQSIGKGVTLHDRLANHIFQKLYQRPPFQDRYKNWPMPLYQAALLNILLGIYCGKDELVSRAVLLLNVLVSTLREVGFFKHDIAALQHKDARFLPYRMIKSEERTRLAIALFRVDCYISTIRSQPMILQPEELGYTLPSTHAAWNAPGLHIWQHRYPEEPSNRSSEMLTSLFPDSTYISASQPFVLLEDIHAGLCAIQVDIWRHRNTIAINDDGMAGNTKRVLQARLDSWKLILDMTVIEDWSTTTAKNSLQIINFIPRKYYYGVEDHTQPNWIDLVTARVKSLYVDALLLHHVLSMNIHADMNGLRTLASSATRKANPQQSDLTHSDVQHRARQWTHSQDSKESLWHACSILDMYRDENSTHSRRTRNPLRPTLSQLQHSQSGALDPIAHIAVAQAALVIWAYAVYNSFGCQFCYAQYPQAYPTDASVVDLMATGILEKGKEWREWGERGEKRVMVDGVPVCGCHLRELVMRFGDCLPRQGEGEGQGRWGWETAETIAPCLRLLVGDDI